jgi:hypothetical protein
MTFPYSTYSYLIIGGSTKAATSSLFSYLAADHQVCASMVKETRFFLDLDYPLPSKYRFEVHGSRYGEFFGGSDASLLRMEATPDYLYSLGTPLRIRQNLPHVRLVFILREPASRLISWYNFAKQMGQIPPAMPPEAYVAAQASAMKNDRNRPQHMRSLEQGRYSHYLSHFYKLFGRNDILILWYEELGRDSLAVVQKLCAFAGIDPPSAEGFHLSLINKTLAIRNPSIHRLYMDLRRRIRYRMSGYASFRRFRETVRSKCEPLYLNLNATVLRPVKVPEDIQTFLREYYLDEAERLESLCGERAPWGITFLGN